MLLFSSNSFVVNGITVFPDHADPNQFWYLPGPVGLETLDGSTEPQFSLIMYAPDVASSGVQGVGFLNVTLCLKLSDSNQQAIIGKIRTQFPDIDNPLLSPVSFDEGSVQIVSLDLQGSGGASAPPGNSSGEAVEHILGASNPELFGNNDALFALTLSEIGATILEKAFQDGLTPVGGIYNLKFTGVQPALDVKITADLKRVYQSFSVDLTAQAYFVSAGIDATFEKLRQDGSIKVEVVNLTTNDPTIADRENWALNLFKDQILATWFQPSLNATTEQAADAQNMALPPPRTGGTTTTTTTQPTKSNASMGSNSGNTSAMKAPNSPSGNMGSAGGSAAGASAQGLAGAGGNATASGSGSNPSGAANASASPSGSGGATTKTGTNTGASQPTTTTSTTSTTGNNPGGVNVSNPLKSLPGTASAASSAASPYSVALRLKFVNQDELKTVEYEFNQMNAVQRTYSPQGYFGLLLQGLDQSKHFLKVDGTDPFFNKFAVTVNPPHDFATIGLLAAHVAMDYGDPSSSSGVKHGEVLFSPANPPQPAQIWDVYEGAIQKTQFTYTADYKFDPESGWIGEQTAYTLPPVTTEDRVLNLDPYDFLGFLQISVVAERLDPNLVDRIEVMLQYQAPSGWQTSNTIIVRPGSAPQFWKLRLADKNSRTYQYTTNCYLKDGTLISAPAVSTTANAIMVSDPFDGGAIDLSLQPAFDPTAYKLAIVEIQYKDTPHNYSFQTTVQIPNGTAAPPPKVHIPLIDRVANSYQYRLTFINSANQQQQGNFTNAMDSLIVVSPGS